MFLHKSLRQFVDTKITKDYPILVENDRLRRADEFLNNHYTWLIPIITLSIYGLIVLIMPRTFLIYESAKSIIDQRTSNYAAIAGTTIAIIGFLLTNLAKKKSFYYELLFKTSYFIPILYYTLTGIAFLIVTSTARDIVNILNFAPYYGSMIIACTVILLIGLGLIFFLFKTIVKFTNENRINQYVGNNLLYYQKQKIHQWLLIEVSDKHINKYLGNKEHKFKRFFTSGTSEYIYDIDMDQLARYIEIHPESRFPKSMFLESPYFDLGKNHEFARSGSIIAADFRKIFKLKQRKIKADPYEIYLVHINREYLNSINENNNSTLTDILHIYKRMIKLYSLADIRQIKNEVNMICWSLTNGIHASLNKSSNEYFENIIGFIEWILQDLVQNNKSRIFASLIDSIPTAYSMASFEKSQNRITTSRQNITFNTVIKHMDSLMFNLKFNFPIEEDPIHQNKIYKSLITSLGTLYRRAIHNDNALHINKINEIVNKQLNIDRVLYDYVPPILDATFEKEQPYEFDEKLYENGSLLIPDSLVYTHHLRVLTRLWLYYLIDNKLITFEQFSIQLAMIEYQKCWLHDLVFLTGNINYFGRNTWYFAEFNDYDKMAFDDGEWIYKSFLIEKLYSKDYDFKCYNIDSDVIDQLLNNFESQGEISDVWNEHYSQNMLGANFDNIKTEIKRIVIPAIDS